MSDTQRLSPTEEAKKLEGMVTGHVDTGALQREIQSLQRESPSYVNDVVKAVNQDNLVRAAQHLPEISLTAGKSHTEPDEQTGKPGPDISTLSLRYSDESSTQPGHSVEVLAKGTNVSNVILHSWSGDQK